MGFFMPIMSAVGAIGGGLMQGSQAQAAGNAQAQASYFNAAVAQQNAIAVRQAAAVEAAQQARKNRSSLETVRSKYLMSGIDLEGTPMMVLDETNANMALDVDLIRHKGEVQATNYLNQASMDTFHGQSSQAAGEARAQGSILGGMFSGISTIGRSLM
jgi:hypothetical protein